MSVLPGTRLGHYEVTSKIGSGGMADVYLARDLRLGRLVAIKLLSAEFTTNREPLGRFKQEARATSALNHPNILTIYEIGRADSRYYIVTEFIDGMTLRRRISRGRLRWTEALDVAIQIVTALCAAHSHGIVHRDIKPENVMLRTDGYVKVLDFGLAKLVEANSHLTPGPEDSTVTNIYTESGTIVGTIQYMSPEQLRLQEIDGQTDIWSVGVVLYEMIAGSPPFQQPTKSDLIVSILDREPPLLSVYVSDVPSELEQIVLKALSKNRDQRYRTANDLLDDLKKVRENFVSDHTVQPSSEPATNTAARVVETAERLLPTESIPTARRTSAVEYLIREIRRGGVGSLILVIAILAVAGLIFFVVHSLVSRPTTPPVSAVEYVELVKTGSVKEAAVSADGNYVVMVITDEGKQGISVRQVSNPHLVSIVSPSSDDYRGLVFSRDGSSVYYLKLDGKDWTVFRVPALGGSSRTVVAHVSSPISMSPDGKHLAFMREGPSGPSLFTANEDGTNEQEITKSPSATPFAVMRDLNNGPAWSPDGNVIACPANGAGDNSSMSIVGVNVSDGSVKPITPRKWYVIGQLGWLMDGSGVVMNAVEDALASSSFQLWLVSFPNGEARRITNNLDYYRGISVTSANSVLTINRMLASSIWLIPSDKASDAVPQANSKDKGAGGLAWMPDGGIVYSVNGPSNHNLWIESASGTDARQLTFDENADVGPTTVADGRAIVFTSYRTGEAHVWRMNADGGDQRQLTFGKGEDWAHVSRDAKWIVYHQDDAGQDSIWKISIDGGQPVKLSQMPAKQPVISPDGKLIACFLRRNASSPWELGILPIDGGVPQKTFPISASATHQWQGPQWTSDGRSLTYIVTAGDVGNIWKQPVNGEPFSQLTDFKENRIVAFAWSIDGTKLACVRSAEISNLILVKNLK